MMRSLYSAVSGLQSHQTRMDVIGNNIANVNTVGFKKSQVAFQDILSQTISGGSEPSTGNSGGSEPSTGNYGGVNAKQIGTGVMVGSISTINTQGAPSTNGNTTNLMIQGEGYFKLERNGANYFTRAGVFSFDKDGYLVNSSNGAYVLDPNDNNINIPNIDSVKNINIGPTGSVDYIDADGDFQSAGVIGLAKFPNPQGLEKVGENMLIETNTSGVADMKTPSEEGSGTLISGSLEMSNVDLAQEFVDMIVTQRGFQANSRTIRVSDEMLQELINIKR